MGYVFSNLSDFGACPTTPATPPPSEAVGRLQDKLGVTGRARDCRYGKSTNNLLKPKLAVIRPSGYNPQNDVVKDGEAFLTAFGLSRADAREVATKIKEWLNGPKGLADGQTSPIPTLTRADLAIGPGTTGTTAGNTGTAAGRNVGTGAGGIRITPGIGVVPGGTRPAGKGAGTGIGVGKEGVPTIPTLPTPTETAPAEEAPPMPSDMMPPVPGAEAPAGAGAAEPWYQKYKWYLVGGSALLVLGVLGVVLVATRKK